jgi:hypothetical protein
LQAHASEVIHGFSDTTILKITESRDAKQLYDLLLNRWPKKKKNPKTQAGIEFQELSSIEKLNVSTDNEKMYSMPRWQIKCQKTNADYSCEIILKK